MLKNLFFLFLVFNVIYSAFLPSAHENIVKNGKWKKLIRVHPDQTVSLTVALKQQNIDKLEKMVEYVSDPNSKSYGKYLSLEQVRVLVQPEDEVVNV
jgi:tripeptidyl-peptidase-1